MTDCMLRGVVAWLQVDHSWMLKALWQALVPMLLALRRRKARPLSEEEQAAQLKAEEEKRAVDVTKTEFVQNALRYAIMRGRQAKVIEKTRDRKSVV